MKLTPQILLQNGWQLHERKKNLDATHLSKKQFSVYFLSNGISVYYAPFSLDRIYIDCFFKELTVENFNKIFEICNLQEFKLHIDKPQKQQGWIVDLSNFNIKSEYFKTAKMLKTWFLGFVRNVYKDDVRRLNNLQFEHVKGGKTIAYFTFKADTKTFSKIFKIE